MSLFDFQCTSCRHLFEDLVKLNEDNPHCPLCQSMTIKLLSVPSNCTKEAINRVNRHLDKNKMSQYKD